MKKHRECVFSAELDMDTLLMAKGPSFPISRLGERLFCPSCHKTHMRIAFTPGRVPHSAVSAR